MNTQNTLKPEEKLSELLKIKTVSSTDYDSMDWSQFDALEKKLEEFFPLMHQKMEKKKVSELGLVFIWKTGNPSGRKPILFLAHYDVVPAPDKEDWKYPPFSGAIEEGKVWGRGARDLKGQLMCMAQAAEELLAEGYEPDRDIWFAFGGDEEVSGLKGAGAVSKWMMDQGLEFEYLLDEGGAITVNSFNMVKKPVGVIGVAEKGFLCLDLVALANDGHASMPPKHTAPGLLARAIHSLENASFPNKLTPPLRNLLKELGKHAAFPLSLVLKNPVIFAPVIKKIFMKSPSMACLIHTTKAVTILKSGDRANVLPTEARATVNFRILPGESIDIVKKRVQGIVGPDVRVEFSPGWTNNEPVIVGQEGGGIFKAFRETAEKVIKDVIYVPYLVHAGTDSKYYAPMCESVFRFTPWFYTQEDLDSIHGKNEALPLKDMYQSIVFYKELIKCR